LRLKLKQQILFLRFQKRPAVVVHRRHPIHATRGASAALLAKKINKDAQPVATSSIGLGFRSFSPIASQSIPPASSNLFLSEGDLPPSNQLAEGYANRDPRYDVAGFLERYAIVGSDVTTTVHDASEHRIFLASHVANVLL